MDSDSATETSSSGGESETGDPATATDTDSETDTDTETDSESDTDTDTDTETDSDSDTDTTGDECVTGDTRPCYTGDPATEGVGTCAPGVETCFNGEWFECMGEVLPSTESCNGWDDDCNGEIDDGELVGIGNACETGEQGVCAAGTRVCNNGNSICEPNTPAGPEICFNNLDDNCNGQADENCFCPYIYAFDGQRWRYETSVGGASLVGRARNLLPGQGKRVRFAPLWARLDAAQVLEDGSVHAQVLAAEDEIVYLDHAELTLVHHPHGHEVVSSSAMQWTALAEKDPRAFYSFATAACRAPQRASWCGELDQRAALSRLSGTPAAYELERENRYELDFGEVSDASHAWLLIDGWKFKRERNLPKALRGRRPQVEIRQADGTWLAVKTLASVRGDRKTVAVDLSGLAWPTGSYELRLSTGTHEGAKAVWCIDRVRLVEAAPAPVEVSRVAVAQAELEYRGAPTLLAARPDLPRESVNDGGGVLGAGDAEGPATYGHFTRYGEVTELVSSPNDHAVVMRQGDCVNLRFDALPPAPARLATSLFLRTNLVFKPRVAMGSEGPTPLTEQVEPMPRRYMGRYELDAIVERDLAYEAYLARWNTRVYSKARRQQAA